MGGAMSFSTLGCRAFHCATALSQYCRPAAPVNSLKHPGRLGRASGNGPGPSQIITLSTQSLSLAGGGTRTSFSMLRSEEHTSELQSLAYLVCRLLLEKKKKTDNLRTQTRATNI